MQYGQIVFLLFVAMVFYYAAMIFMDFQRAKAAQNAEQDSHKEEDIDISEEARSFRPIRINRVPACLRRSTMLHWDISTAHSI